MRLVPSLSEDEAEEYIVSWKLNCSETLEQIRAGEDVTTLNDESGSILNDLMNKANLSGYHR